MPIVKLDDVEKQTFPNGATYQTIVGDDEGSTPVRVGVQGSRRPDIQPVHTPTPIWKW